MTARESSPGRRVSRMRARPGDSRGNFSARARPGEHSHADDLSAVRGPSRRLCSPPPHGVSFEKYSSSSSSSQGSSLHSRQAGPGVTRRQFNSGRPGSLYGIRGIRINPPPPPPRSGSSSFNALALNKPSSSSSSSSSSARSAGAAAGAAADVTATRAFAPGPASHWHAARATASGSAPARARRAAAADRPGLWTVTVTRDFRAFNLPVTVNGPGHGLLPRRHRDGDWTGSVWTRGCVTVKSVAHISIRTACGGWGGARGGPAAHGPKNGTGREDVPLALSPRPAPLLVEAGSCAPAQMKMEHSTPGMPPTLDTRRLAPGRNPLQDTGEQTHGRAGLATDRPSHRCVDGTCRHWGRMPCSVFKEEGRGRLTYPCLRMLTHPRVQESTAGGSSRVVFRSRCRVICTSTPVANPCDERTAADE